MIAINITSTKDFMSKLLAGDAFDPFLFIEGMLCTSINYTFDGKLNREYFVSEENAEGSDAAPEYEYQPWGDAKKTMFNLIKGSRTPLFFRFVLKLKPEKAQAMLEKSAPEEDFSLLNALLLNVKFEGGKVTLTTGTSYSSFVMSHEADKIWDKAICAYLSGKHIEFEIM